MIEVNIVGQLGNQLFEYACARQLQEKYGGKIYLNTYEMRQNTPNFRLALLDFNLNENVEVVSERPLKEANADNYSVKILRKFFPDLYFNMMAKKGVFVWKSARIYKHKLYVSKPVGRPSAHFARDFARNGAGLAAHVVGLHIFGNLFAVLLLLLLNVHQHAAGLCV